jgi:excisionase family DNA binding protein
MRVMTTAKTFISVSDAAVLLGVSRQRVLNLITMGTLSADKVGSIYIVKTDSVKSYSEKERKAGRPRKNPDEENNSSAVTTVKTKRKAKAK